MVKCTERVQSAELPAQPQHQFGQGAPVNDVRLRISRMVNTGINFTRPSALVSS